MNIIKILKEKYDATPRQVTILNNGSSPAIGGCYATFYQDEDNTVYVELDDENFRITGIIPAEYAEEARDIDYDPYNTAAYTRNCISLACEALGYAEYHQTERDKKAKKGGYDVDIEL